MNFYQLFILVLLAFATSNALKPAYLSAILQDPANFPNLNLSSLFHEQDESNSNYSSHERRWAGPIPAPADDATWEAAKCKGRKFMAQMSYSDYDVGQMLPIPQISVQSPFSFNSLTPWGYVMSGVDYVYRNFNTGGYWGVADFLNHIGVSDRCREEGGLWNAAVITHYRPGGPGSIPTDRQTYVGPDNYVRRMTSAYFYMAVNPQGGIMVQNTLGPRSAADRIHPNNFPDWELPEMQKLSDMMWAMWEFYVPAAQRPGINFFMSLGIDNVVSKGLIRRALDTVGMGLTQQPVRFDPNSDGGLAMLGSPNGARVAHFLTQRKLQIGLKTVTAVWVFECSSASRAPCIMFQVGTLATPVSRPQSASAKSNLASDTDLKATDGGDKKRRLMKKEFVREHTFRAVDGNVSLSSEYV